MNPLCRGVALVGVLCAGWPPCDALAQDRPIEAGMALVKVNYLPQEAGAIKRYRCALVVESKTGLGSSALGRTVKRIPIGATILKQVSDPLR